MSQKEIEVILTRQLASYLAVPVLIVDTDGTLLYFNEPAEAIFARRFDETGEMRLESQEIRSVSRYYDSRATARIDAGQAGGAESVDKC